MQYLHVAHEIHSVSEVNFVDLVDKIHLCIYCLQNGVPLRRLYRPGARNDWFRLLQPEDRVIVSEHLSYQEPRLSDGLRHYHGDELNIYDDHEEEEDDELEEIIKERRRNSVNRDEGFRAMYRERFNESNYDNSVREDPSSYERRMQQNLRISSQSNRYDVGETRSDRSYNNPRANSSRRSNFVSDTYGVEVSRLNRSSRSNGPRGRDDVDSNFNRNNNFNNFASRSTGFHARDGSNSNRNHFNFGSRRSSGPQVQNNSNFNTRNNNAGSTGSIISSGRSGRVQFRNEDATRSSTGTTRSNGTPGWGNSSTNNAPVRARNNNAGSTGSIISSGRPGRVQFRNEDATRSSTGTTRSNGTPGWGNSSTNNAPVRASGSSGWNNVVTTSRNTRGWGSSTSNNDATTRTASRTLTSLESSVKNKTDSSSAEPSPRPKKIQKLQKGDVLPPPSNFVEYANSTHGTENQASRLNRPKEVEAALSKMFSTLEKKISGDLKDPPIVDSHSNVPEESKKPAINEDHQDSKRPAKVSTSVTETTNSVTERKRVCTRSVSRRIESVPVIQVRSDFLEKFHAQIDLLGGSFCGYATNELPKKWWDKDVFTHHARAKDKTENIREALRLTKRGRDKIIALAQKEHDELNCFSDSEEDIYDSPTPHMGDVIDSNTAATDDTLITLDRLEYILTKISENSMIWDVGLQMMVLKQLNCDASYEEVSKWSKKTLCPCGLNHRQWFQRENISSDEFSEGLCKGQIFTNITQLKQHLYSKSKTCLIHLAVFHYTCLMYPDFFKVDNKMKRNHPLLFVN